MAAAATLGWDQVAAWRAARHHLDERAPAKAMLEVVAGIAGLHAQVMSSAELTLEARVEGLEPGAVRRALWEERSLVKTWAMRGTLQLLPAAELPMWQAARSTRRWWETGSWQRGFGVTVDELGALLKPAAALGLVCFAPSQGQQVRFTRPDTWLGGWTSHDPEEAMDQVTRRFLAASGPVTREDFARWWGIPSPAQGRKLLERLGDEVARVEVEGTAAYALAADLDGLGAAGGSRTVRLLPAFDQYVVTATRHAERLMPGPFKARVYRPRAGCRRCCWSGAAWRASGARR